MMYKAVYFLFFIGYFSYGQEPSKAKPNLKGTSLAISNISPRLDTEGNIVDAHDGRIIQFGDTFYWYGTAYGNTNGFTTANYYQCYSSTDLKSWKKEGRLLPDQPEGVYYRPHVIFNENSKKYVLWYNWYPQLWDGQFGVAVSDSPLGPFRILNDNVKMANSAIGLGDFGLFVDDDKTAYISYNTIKNHQVSIEKLDADYTASTLNNGGVIAQNMEAGSQFKRGGKYYLLTDYTCCFCNYGSGARVYVSENPMTGYQLTGNINRYPGRPSAVLQDGGLTGTRYETIQKRDTVFEGLELVFKGEKIPDSLSLYLFTGNRPENCGDVSNPRVHPKIETPEFTLSVWDFDHWREIDSIGTSVVKSALSEKLTMALPKLKGNRLRLSPKADNPFPAIYINEITTSGRVGFQSYVVSADIADKPIIPAQQTYVLQLETASGPQYIWMGDLWGSASDNIKGHDYQYWSEPLEFNADGTIRPLEWTDQWQVEFKE